MNHLGAFVAGVITGMCLLVFLFLAGDIGCRPVQATPLYLIREPVDVYRFWSPTLECHFYTIAEAERDKLIDDYPHVWTYEGVAGRWYPPGEEAQP